MTDKLQSLIQTWEDRLTRFRKNPSVAKGMDERVALGVSNSRIIATRECLKELKKALEPDIVDYVI